MSVRRASNTPAPGTTARSRGLSHIHPGSVSLQTALEALSDPVRRMIIRDLAEHPDWSRACGTFDLPVGKATRSHHFAVLRDAGVIEQRDEGARRLNRLRRAEFEAAFPGLLALVDGETDPGTRAGDETVSNAAATTAATRPTEAADHQRQHAPPAARESTRSAT